jgi:cell division septum initiation protein DivIVA
MDKLDCLQDDFIALVDAVKRLKEQNGELRKENKKLKLEIAEHNNEKIYCGYKISNIMMMYPKATVEQVHEIMQKVHDRMDCELGVCWETFKYWTGELYPELKLAEGF